MGSRLPNWSYSEKNEKIAGCFPYYDEQGNDYCGMIKIGPITSGWDDNFEKTNNNFIEKSSLSLDLTDVVRRICGEEETSIGHIVFGPISNERDEEGELINEEIETNLFIEELPEEALLEKEIQKGFYKGNLISYQSIDDNRLRFNQELDIIWNDKGTGTLYTGFCTIECRILGEETPFTSQTKEGEVSNFILTGLPAYDNDGNLITYVITEILSNNLWSVELNNIRITYNPLEIGIILTNSLNTN